MALLILYFTVSIVVSFLCSLWEATFLSISPSFVEIKSQENSWMGKKLHKYKQNIDQPLSAILTLNTMAHTLGAVGVGSQSAKIWGSAYFSLLGIQMNIEGMVAGLMTLRSEEHTSELQSRGHLVCRLLLE